MITTDIRFHERDDLADVLIEFYRQIRSANNARRVRRNRDPMIIDLDEESANLLASRTREWLGYQHLALAGRAEQAIISLF